MTLGALFAGKSEASSALGHFDRGSQKGLEAVVGDMVPEWQIRTFVLSVCQAA